MVTNALTAHLDIEKPDAANTVAEDMARLILALDKIDGFLKANIDAIATKAASGHAHEIADVNGLQAALNSLSAAISALPTTLAALADTDTSSASEGMVLQYLANQWKAVAAKAEFFAITTINGLSANNVQAALAELLSNINSLSSSTSSQIDALSSSTAAALALKAPKADPVFTGAPTLPNINAGPLRGLQSPVVNGGFEVWQEGTGPFTTSSYCADGWWFRPATGATAAVNRASAGVEGVTAVPGRPQFYAYITQTVAGTDSCYIENRMEGVDTLNGEEVTVTFYISADAPIDLSFGIVQNFGTGGAPSGEVFTQAIAQTTFSTGWQKVQAKFTIPSIAGKTLGTNGNDSLKLRILFDPAATFVCRLTRASIKRGNALAEDDPFEELPQDVVWGVCRRFFRRHGKALSGYADTSAQVFLYDIFDAPMRAAPNITLLDTSPLISSAGSTHTGTSSAIDDSGSTQGGFHVRINGFSGLTGSAPVYVRQVDDIIALDARL